MSADRTYPAFAAARAAHRRAQALLIGTACAAERWTPAELAAIEPRAGAPLVFNEIRLRPGRCYECDEPEGGVAHLSWCLRGKVLSGEIDPPRFDHVAEAASLRREGYLPVHDLFDAQRAGLLP